MYELTKTDITAMRQASYMLVASNADGEGTTKVEFTKQFPKSATNPYEHREHHLIDAPVRVTKEWAGTFEKQYRCLTSISLYQSQACQASSIFATLRAGDSVVFQFWPDCGTGDYLKAAGLHDDRLSVLVYRKGRLAATFDLEHSVMPENSARMCRRVVAQYQIVAA